MNVKDLSVLLVDDFEMARKLVWDLLTEIGITQIHEASSAYDAVNFLKEKKAKVDIIFSDWNMPGMTGLDLLKFIKEEEAYQKILFVMVTAESDASSIMSAVREGSFDYLVKPVDLKDINGIVARIVKTENMELNR